jgi:hypothetical protein
MGQPKLKPISAQPIFEPFEDDGLRVPANNRVVANRVKTADAFLARTPHVRDEATCNLEVIGA